MSEPVTGERLVVPYSLAFRRPIATGAGAWTRRRGAWLLLVAPDGRRGLGEIAPLQSLPDDDALERACADPGLVETALVQARLDLQAQAAGVPLATFLGGDRPGSVETNALGFAATAREAAEEAGQARDLGFRTLKLKVGAASPEEDIRRIAAIRERVGAAMALRLDANGAWDEATALRVLRAVAPLDIEYVEDPVAGDARAVRSRSGIPVAADVRSLQEGREVVREHRADVLVLKPQALGGLLATRELALAAIEAGLGVVVTSVFDSPAGVAGALHLAASLPGPARAHGLATVDLLEESPLEGLPSVEGGTLPLPAGPGLGVRGLPAAR